MCYLQNREEGRHTGQRGVSVGETLKTQGLDWCITQGNVLVNTVSKAISALLHEQLLPTLPQTHRPSRLLGSKQTHHMAKQETQPVRRGSPAPHLLRTPGSCLLPSPHSSQEQPLHKPKPSAEAHTLPGSPLKSPG